MKKIFLSPSNQSKNRYAYGNTTEDVQCGLIADACKIALERCGFEVKVEQYDTLQNRVAHSNSWEADLHVPIHTNAFNGSVTGTRLFYLENDSNGYKACQSIFKYLAPITPGKSENIKSNKTFYELLTTEMSSAYIEAEFHDNKDAAKWIIENVVEIGEAIAHGICDYFNYEWVSPIVETEEEFEETDKNYYVQIVTVYTEKKKANEMVEKLMSAGFNAIILDDDGEIVAEEIEKEVENETIVPEVSIAKGDKVKMQKNAPIYGQTSTFSSWVYNKTLYVREILGDRVVISTKESGAVTGAVNIKYLTKV